MRQTVNLARCTPTALDPFIWASRHSLKGVHASVLTQHAVPLSSSISQRAQYISKLLNEYSAKPPGFRANSCFLIYFRIKRCSHSYILLYTLLTGVTVRGSKSYPSNLLCKVCLSPWESVCETLEKLEITSLFLRYRTRIKSCLIKD